MNMMSINLYGLKFHKKKSWIKKLCIDHLIKVLGVQETKMS